jgi:hypothetical protein
MAGAPTLSLERFRPGCIVLLAVDEVSNRDGGDGVRLFGEIETEGLGEGISQGFGIVLVLPDVNELGAMVCAGVGDDW